jgi:hypothetical protein
VEYYVVYVGSLSNHQSTIFSNYTSLDDFLLFFLSTSLSFSFSCSDCSLPLSFSLSLYPIWKKWDQLNAHRPVEVRRRIRFVMVHVAISTSQILTWRMGTCDSLPKYRCDDSKSGYLGHFKLFATVAFSLFCIVNVDSYKQNQSSYREYMCI